MKSYYGNYTVDTHTHTIVSGHAYNTIKEMIQTAIDKNFDVLCITDHGPALIGSATDFYFTNLRIIDTDLFRKPYNHAYLKVFLGMEANILDYDGNTDYDTLGDDIHNLKFIIASAHKCCITPGSKEENTNMYIGALNKPYVSVLGHIDDGIFECDYEKIVKTAKEKNVLIEVNNSSNSKTGFRLNSNENTLEYLQLCKENGVMISLGSDAHWDQLIGKFDNVIPLLEKVNFPHELIINANPDYFIEFVEKKYKERLAYYGIKMV